MFGQKGLFGEDQCIAMPEARLQLELPKDVWIGELSRTYPDATFRILAAQSDEKMGVGLIQIIGDSLSQLLAEMGEYEAVADMEILNETDRRALVQFETTLPLLLLPARDSGVPLEMPFEITNGTAVWEITAPSENLTELGNQLDFFDISFTIDYIQYEVKDEQLLTATQQEILDQAIELGYYDIPRECSQSYLAEEVGRAKSTVSETLHRAESKIIKQFRGEVDPSDEPLPNSESK